MDSSRNSLISFWELNYYFIFTHLHNMFRNESKNFIKQPPLIRDPCFKLKVTKLELSASNLAERIQHRTPKIEALGDNSLLDSIPPEILKINSRILSLENTQISAIPSYSSALLSTNITNLCLSQNKICSIIPNQVSSLIQLAEIYSNQTKGLKSNLMSDLNNLEYLRFNNNEISNRIPHISKLTNLEPLYLNYNRLFGNIPYPLPSNYTYFIGDQNIPMHWQRNPFTKTSASKIQCIKHLNIDIHPIISHILDFGLQIPFAGVEEGEIPISAIVFDVNLWNSKIPDEQKGVTIPLNNQNNEYFVTATCSPELISTISRKDFIKSLRLPQIVDYCETLKDIRDDTGISSIQKLEETFNTSGENVVLSIIDGGIDFLHSHFINLDGTTRFECICDQNSLKTNIGFRCPNIKGTIFSNDNINQILQNQEIHDKYSEIGHKPKENCHGTHVADIAGGISSNNSRTGIAPKSDLIFVNIEESDTIFHSKRKWPVHVKSSKLMHTNQIIDGTNFSFNKARDRPAVINVSLGGQEGPHDGTTHIEQAFDSLLQQEPNRAIVIAAGNDTGKKTHTYGSVSQHGYTEITWDVRLDSIGHSQIEIWYSGKDSFGIELFEKDNIIETIGFGEYGKLVLNGTDIGCISHYQDNDNRDNCIFIFLKSNVKLITKLKLKIIGELVNTGEYHGWISNYQNSSCKFIQTDNSNAIYDSNTINGIATGKYTIAVGSYSLSHENRLSHFSSLGPTRDGREHPHICAPGQNIWAAKSLSTNAVVKKNGTSQAAPVVSGIIARILSSEYSKGNSFTIENLKKFLADNARKDSNDNVWHKGYGYGRVLVQKTVEEIIKL